MAPVAVLLMNSVMKVPTKHTEAITSMGLSPQTLRMPLASICARPVFSIAVPSTTEPANTMRMFQLMLLKACDTEQQRSSTMTRAARKAASRRVITLSDESSIMPIMMSAESSVFLPMLGMSLDSKKCSWRFTSSLMFLAEGGHSRSTVSPACSTISRGLCSMRSPRRATATRVRFSFSENPVSPQRLPMALLPKLT